MTNKPGYWAKALSERYADENSLLFFYVSASGDVPFGINCEEKGIFFSGVDTRSPRWVLIDLYGLSTSLEIVGKFYKENAPFLHSVGEFQVWHLSDS